MGLVCFHLWKTAASTIASRWLGATSRSLTVSAFSSFCFGLNQFHPQGKYCNNNRARVPWARLYNERFSFFEPGAIPDNARIHDPSRLRQSELHTLWRHWLQMQEEDDGMGLRFVACDKSDWRSEPSGGRSRSRKPVKYVEPDDDDDFGDNGEGLDKGKGKAVARSHAGSNAGSHAGSHAGSRAGSPARSPAGSPAGSHPGSEEDVAGAVLNETESDRGGGEEGAQIPNESSPAAVPHTRAAQLDFLQKLSPEPAYLNRVTFIEQNLVFFSFLQFNIWLNSCVG
jgi:hypothetical protein